MSPSTTQIQPTSVLSSDLAVEFWNEMACIRILVTDMRRIPGQKYESWRKPTVVRIPTAGTQRNGQISEVWPIFQVRKSLEMSKYWADKVTRNISEMTGHDSLAEPPDIRRQSLAPWDTVYLLNLSLFYTGQTPPTALQRGRGPILVLLQP